MRYRSILITLFIFPYQVVAQQRVTFDITKLRRGNIEKGFASLNTCWLVDSDIHYTKKVSNAVRFSEMRLKSLRFPYGHMADNYLWDTPPFGSSPLQPKVGTTARPPYWQWGVNKEDGSFKKAMDFDEFMDICQKRRIEPLVVVNVFSYKYKNGPSYEELKQTAVEWVRYAKKKNYKVAYWEIGNEIDHHQDELSKKEYMALYRDFVEAMKAIDPTIKCGPGILGTHHYLYSILKEMPQLVDFTTAHQYLFRPPFKKYEDWVAHDGSNLNSNIKKLQIVVNTSTKPDLPILITETNVFGNWDDNKLELYKGLSLFDLLLSQQEYDDVSYSYLWGSHSPYNRKVGAEDIACTFTNDVQNNFTITGEIMKILNKTTQQKLMIPNQKVNNNIYSYGTYTPKTRNASMYFINKSLNTSKIEVHIEGYTPNKKFESWVFTGSSPYDPKPTLSQYSKINISKNGFKASLPPYSLVIVKLSSKF